MNIYHFDIDFTFYYIAANDIQEALIVFSTQVTLDEGGSEQLSVSKVSEERLKSVSIFDDESKDGRRYLEYYAKTITKPEVIASSEY